jgi:phenylalanyl-tRNA synthetase alpha chain
MSEQNTLQKLIQQCTRLLALAKVENREQLEEFRVDFLSKNGFITPLMQRLKYVDKEEKKAAGKAINALKAESEARYNAAKSMLTSPTHAPYYDPTLPFASTLGGLHPLSRIQDKIVGILTQRGFAVANGPEIEDDWHNFAALNFPPDHPAREMQDTLFVASSQDLLLRTHTSSVQVRIMERTPPPIRIIAPGKVFRKEAISARSHCVFHQIEALYIDKKVTFANLKEIVHHFVHQFFGKKTKLRFRPSYFPFTEPSAEVDISCLLCNQEGCILCKHSGWVEIAGAGMVHPNVLKSANIPETYQGYAFGIGLERLAMISYQIPDIRLFTENNITFLKQFAI